MGIHFLVISSKITSSEAKFRILLKMHLQFRAAFAFSYNSSKIRVTTSFKSLIFFYRATLLRHNYTTLTTV